MSTMPRALTLASLVHGNVGRGDAVKYATSRDRSEMSTMPTLFTLPGVPTQQEVAGSLPLKMCTLEVSSVGMVSGMMAVQSQGGLETFCVSTHLPPTQARQR